MTERTMQFMYTCRLCGETYCGMEQKTNPESAVDAIVMRDYNSNSVLETKIHECSDSTFGISDLIGVKPKDEQ